MPSCSVYKCKSRTKRKKGEIEDNAEQPKVTFHKFPNDKALCADWLRNLHYQNFKPAKHSKVCSKHFLPECFDTTGQTTRLKENSVPTLFPTLPDHLQKKGLVIAGFSDLTRPAEKLSLGQSSSLAVSGLIWSRYSTIITPRNWYLFSVDRSLAFVGISQLIRIFMYRCSLEKEVQEEKS